MRSQAITEFGKPLQEIETPTPVPTGTEVLLVLTNCGPKVIAAGVSETVGTPDAPLPLSGTFTLTVPLTVAVALRAPEPVGAKAVWN